MPNTDKSIYDPNDSKMQAKLAKAICTIVPRNKALDNITTTNCLLGLDCWENVLSDLLDLEAVLPKIIEQTIKTAKYFKTRCKSYLKTEDYLDTIENERKDLT